MVSKKADSAQHRPSRTVKPKRRSRLSEDELTAMEISEDKRLRESGIDPNGDPFEILKAVVERYQALKIERS